MEESRNPYPFRIFSRPDKVVQPLLNNVVNLLGVELGKTVFKEFKNGEFLPYHDESIRDCDVDLFLQPRYGNKEILSYDLDLMESMVMAFKQGSPNRITVIIPCLPYARQDRSTNYREPVLVQKIPMRLQMAGADRIVTLRLHNPSSYNAHSSTIRIENIPTKKLFIKHVLSKGFDMQKFKIVAPDAGADSECRILAKELGIPNNIIILNKIHDNTGVSEVEIMNVIGDPADYNCIVFDDMADTCGTASKAFKALKDEGALDIYFAAVHPILSGEAIENMAKVNFKEIWFSDTCDWGNKQNQIKNLDIISAATLISKVIENLHNGGSLTDLSK